jgi:hypothetical protein
MAACAWIVMMMKRDEMDLSDHHQRAVNDDVLGFWLAMHDAPRAGARPVLARDLFIYAIFLTVGTRKFNSIHGAARHAA